MSIVPDAENSPDETIQIFYYCAMGIETIEIATNFYVFTVYVLVVAKKATLHRNLRFLLILLPACHMFFFLARLTTNFFALMQMDSTRKSVQRIADLSNSIFYGISAILASERLIAAWFGTKYEENAISLTVPALSAFLIAIFTAYMAILSWNQFLNYFHVYSILGSFVIYSSVVSLLLPYIARRQQKMVFRKRFSGLTTLSGRIQVEENVRTAQALRLVLPYIGISSLSLLLCYIGVWTITRRNFPDWFLVYGKLTMATYYALNASQTLICMLLLLFYHKSLRKKLAVTFPNFVKASHKLVKIHQETKRLAMTKQEEKELYFESYRKQWS